MRPARALTVSCSWRNLQLRPQFHRLYVQNDQMSWPRLCAHGRSHPKMGERRPDLNFSGAGRLKAQYENELAFCSDITVRLGLKTRGENITHTTKLRREHGPPSLISPPIIRTSVLDKMDLYTKSWL